MGPPRHHPRIDLAERDFRLDQGRERLDLWLASSRHLSSPFYQESQSIEHFTFNEREDYEKGFAKLYDQEIAPYLRDKETHRQAAITRSKRWIALVLAITAFLALQAYKIDPILPIFPTFFGLMGVLFLYLSRTGKVQKEITQTLRPILCEFFPDTEYSDLAPTTDFSADTLRGLNIIPTADHSNFGPSITGAWRDTPYLLTKASFYNERRDNDGDSKRERVFSGIILQIDCVIDMPTIVFYPDFGKTMNKLYGWATRNKRPDHKLTLPDPEIEKVFEVYTDDLDEANARLSPDFGTKLLSFSRDYQKVKKHISAAFRGRKFYLAIDLPHDFMNFDVGNRPLSEANEAIHKALSDIMIPCKIIDILLDPEPEIP